MFASLTIPSDIAPHADSIHSDDPRFASLLPAGTTLREAAASGAIDQNLIDEVAVCARYLLGLTVEEQMHSLIDYAYRVAIGKDATAEWLGGLDLRYGVTGTPETLQAAGDFIGVTRERVRQVTAKLEKYMLAGWVPALDKILRLLIEQSPVADPVGAATSVEGLSEPDLTAASVQEFVRLTGTDVLATTGTDIQVVDGWMVDTRDKGVVGAGKIAAKHTSTYGMTNIEEIRQELSTAESQADEEDVRRVLEADPRVRWADGWLWVEKENDSPYANSMVNSVRSMLSVNAPLSVRSLQEGVRRKSGFRGREIVPPIAPMRIFLSQSPHFVVADDMVSPVSPLDYHKVHGEVAAATIDVLKANSNMVMDRISLYEACEAAGISKNTVNVWTSFAEWMENYGLNAWGLRGSHPNPAVVEEVQRAARARRRTEPRRTEWAWSPAGGIVLTMDVSTSARYSGTFGFDPAFKEIVGSRTFVILHDEHAVGEMRTSAEHSWTWGWAKAFEATATKVGDVLQVNLDLAAGNANVVRGGRELWS